MTDRPVMCGCESAHHFDYPRGLPEWGARTSHEYLAVPAGTRRAYWVGEVCDHCADDHLTGYLVTDERD